MQQFIIFIVLLSFLFLLSKLFIKTFSKALFLITRSNTITVTIISLLFFPGVVVHELAHLLTAGILFVPVGDMELVPKIGEGGEVRLGSVQIAKTDPIRRMIIGIAPVIFGLSLIVGVPYFMQGKLDFAFTALVIYLLFVVGNTMFSSKKDLEGAAELIVVLVILGLALYFMNFKVPLELVQRFLESEKTASFIKEVNFLLLWTIGIDVSAYLVSSILVKVRR